MNSLKDVLYLQQYITSVRFISYSMNLCYITPTIKVTFMWVSNLIPFKNVPPTGGTIYQQTFFSFPVVWLCIFPLCYQFHLLLAFNYFFFKTHIVKRFILSLFPSKCLCIIAKNNKSERKNKPELLTCVFDFVCFLCESHFIFILASS